MKTCWFIVIESMGSWWVDCEGKPYGPFDSSTDAAVAAKRIALTYATTTTDPKSTPEPRMAATSSSGPAPIQHRSQSEKAGLSPPLVVLQRCTKNTMIRTSQIGTPSNHSPIPRNMTSLLAF